MTGTGSTTTPAPTPARARCGDSIVQRGVEACDDGNQVDEDAARRAVRTGALRRRDHARRPASRGPGLRLATTATSITVTPAPTAMRRREVAATRSSMSEWNNATTATRSTTTPAATRSARWPAAATAPSVPAKSATTATPTTTTPAATSATRARCGDGLIQAGETCDDANRIDNDAAATPAKSPPAVTRVRRNDLAEDVMKPAMTATTSTPTPASTPAPSPDAGTRWRKKAWSSR